MPRARDPRLSRLLEKTSHPIHLRKPPRRAAHYYISARKSRPPHRGGGGLEKTGSRRRVHARNRNRLHCCRAGGERVTSRAYRAGAQVIRAISSKFRRRRTHPRPRKFRPRARASPAAFGDCMPHFLPADSIHGLFALCSSQPRAGPHYCREIRLGARGARHAKHADSLRGGDVAVQAPPRRAPPAFGALCRRRVLRRISAALIITSRE